LGLEIPLVLEKLSSWNQTPALAQLYFLPAPYAQIFNVRLEPMLELKIATMQHDII